jgi:hypothetical protein
MRSWHGSKKLAVFPLFPQTSTSHVEKMRGTIGCLLLSCASALVLPSGILRVATPQRCTLRMQLGDATRDMSDDEGNSVQGIEKEAVSFADYVAGLDAPEPTLPAEKAALIVLPEPSWKVSIMAVSDIDLAIELECAAMDYTETMIEIEPMMNTFQEYFFGFTADSHASFSIDHDRSSPMEGTMGRRGNDPLEIFVKCDTNGQVGEFVAHVGCILPEEPDFSKFYKVTVTTK